MCRSTNSGALCTKSDWALSYVQCTDGAVQLFIRTAQQRDVCAADVRHRTVTQRVRRSKESDGQPSLAVYVCGSRPS